MKKSLLYGMAALITVGFASCQEDKESGMSATLSVGAFNLFTPITPGDGEPFVSGNNYSFTLTYPQAVIAINAPAISAPGGSLISFTTSGMPIKSTYPQIDGKQFETVSFSGAEPSIAGAQISNLRGILTNAIYYPDNYSDPSFLPDYLWPFATVPNAKLTFLQYQLDKWNVRTFWNDLTYMGNTITTYPQSPDPFNSESIKYRVMLLANQDGTLTGTANLIFYNAQFAPQAPELQAIVVEGLDVKFTQDGYTLSGTDIVPLCKMDGGELFPLQAFTFNAVNATVDGDLTGINLTYTVAGIYQGTFLGSCVQK